MKVIFSLRAKSDLSEFAKYTANDNLLASRRWVANIRRTVLKLSDFPHLGRIVHEYGEETFREAIKGQYRIVYRIDSKNGTIVVLTIHHSKRKLIL
jgi:toxin ParE1/3/4